MSEFFGALPLLGRIVMIVGVAAGSHLLVRLFRRIAAGWLTPAAQVPSRRRPKVASLLTILVSTVTFTIYFLAFGLILRELGVPLTAYLTSASVIGLAVGFGSQGLVQDVVTGFTLIFSDVLDVGDIVDIGGQTGRVESIGLRFTVLINLLEQRVYLPNRNITQISRYRNGHVRGYLDVQIPEGVDPAEVERMVETIARAMQEQHQGVLLAPPENLGVRSVEGGRWRYLRTKFRLWPGQGALIETTLRQRVIAAMKGMDDGYADWMVAVTYRAE